MAFALRGISTSNGIAVGRVHVIDRARIEVIEREIPARRVKDEIARLRRALRGARAELRAIKRRIPADAPSDVAGFLDAHLLMLDDASLTKAPVACIRERRCSAEWALKIQRDALVEVFGAMEDEYLRARKDDVDHVINRVQRILLRGEEAAADEAPRLTERVVVADDLTPGDTVLMHHQGVVALVTEFGGPNSHTAILARSLGIPAVVGLRAARSYLRDDEIVVIDGREGVVLGDLDEGLLEHYRARQRELKRRRAARRELRLAAAKTVDGHAVSLQANVELPADISAANRVGATGIGLYRTEFLFMNREGAPGEREQCRNYTSLVRRLKGAPVTIRTLDIGADKQIDGAATRIGMNPALGLRAVRFCLREQGLFRAQLRAILRASAHGPVRLMIPMLSNVQELHQVLGLLEDCRVELRSEGVAFDEKMPVGAMIEVPAAAVCADLFARYLDFLSIGTNDLIQYTIAIDRIDDEVNYLYDPLNPAVLRLIQTTIRAGRKAGIPVAMCGEMAGDPRYTRLLLGMGLREFSVHPNALLEIKQVVNESEIGRSEGVAGRLMRSIKASTRAALIDELNGATGS